MRFEVIPSWKLLPHPSVGLQKTHLLEGRGPKRGVVLGSPDVVNVVVRALQRPHPGILPDLARRCTGVGRVAREAACPRAGWPARSAPGWLRAPRAVPSAQHAHR